MTTLFTFLVLQLMMYNLGLLTVDVNLTSLDRPGTGGDAWTTEIIALLSYFAGGFVAVLNVLARSGSAGTLSGFLVAALSLGLILLFSVLCLSGLFRALGAIASQFLTPGGPFSPQDFGSINPSQYAGEVRNAGWWGAISALLAAGAAALGGYVGDIDRAPSEGDDS